jgi:hypothetical protein
MKGYDRRAECHTSGHYSGTERHCANGARSRNGAVAALDNEVLPRSPGLCRRDMSQTTTIANIRIALMALIAR